MLRIRVAIVVASLAAGSIAADRVAAGNIGTAPVSIGRPGGLSAVGSAEVHIAYVAPVGDPVVVLRGFEPPPTPYARGHRGVDLAVHAGGQVRAAQAGVVRFAGHVAGRGVVVVQHADGISTEYEPVDAVVRMGAVVTRGQPLGTVVGRHGVCVPNGCLHWGARRAGGYFDPMSLLEALGPVRLVPWTDR